MLTVSDSFKQAMHQSTKSLRSKVIVDNTTISDNDGLISFAIESDGYLFGSAVSIAVIKLLGTNYDLVGHDIELKTSTKTDQTNDTWEELLLGQFQIVEQQVDLEKGTTTLKCFDALIRLSKIPYIAGDLVFPNTIANIATQLATRHGLIIDDSVANLPNANQVIAQDPYAKISNLTYRDILNEIAGATGTMAIIKNGNLCFQPAQKTSIGDWTYDHLKKIKFKPKYGPINALVLARTPQEDNVAERDEASIVAPGNRNILDMTRYPSWLPSQTLMKVEPIGRSSVRIKATLNNQSWWAANFTLPVANMTSGKTYSVSFGKLVGNRKKDMGVIFDCVRKSDNKRTVLFEWFGYDDKHGKFVYQPEIYRNYRLLLFVSRGGSNVYTGNFDGTFHDIYLAEEDAFSGFVEFKENGLTDVKIANNELLDDNREAMLMPLFNSIKGFEFYPFEAEIEGHGYYQIGDRITVSNGTDSWPIVITHIKLDISQGIKETISGVAPTKEQTDYARAGGIIKTIYNTEIAVDKQQQEIRSVVEKTTQLDDKIEANHSQIIQNINSITNSIQTTGGSNLLHNSVGYATNTERVPTIWTKTGNVIANTSPESLTFGAKSGSQIILSPNSSIAQTIVVAHYQPVSISARVKKGLIGQATISISTNDSDKRTIEISNNQEYLWQEVKLDNFIPELSDLTVKVETTNNAILTITDLMLNVGDKTIPWQQASGEIYNTNVIIDIDGMIIKNSVYAGDYMKFTPLEIANYSNASGTEKKTFWLNRDLTNVQKLQAVDQITMPPVKIIPITETNRAGWAFVADKGEN